jgi:hypothetical protein
MAYERKASGTMEYDFPVELVWRALTGNSTGNLVDPLDEETYENTQPSPGTVFTRSLEVVTNERFVFQIKTTMYSATWRITLKSTGKCSTRINVEEAVKFNDMKAYALSRFGLGLSHEVRYFMKDISSKLTNYEKKLKLDKR